MQSAYSGLEAGRGQNRVQPRGCDEGLAAYKIWAPAGSVWSRWAKPVLFMNNPHSQDLGRNVPDISWFGEFRRDTAIILDLPGVAGVEEAIAFARIGYRPVPLYNGVDPLDGESEVNATGIARLLFQTASEVASIQLSSEAPPVFMIDEARKGAGTVLPGVYDNRWNIFPQDMPSSDFLRGRGIRNILVRSNMSALDSDLEHVLFRYAEKKEIRLSQYHSKSDAVKPLSVDRPPAYRSTFYRLKVILGLKRNAAGGFGALTPEPVEVSGAGEGSGWSWSSGSGGFG